MVTIDLITGFLGAGKTTFLKKYASYFMDRGQRIGILENDFGAVNVDMLLLNDLRGPLCELEMVAGGCDAHCHKRRFNTKLISMAMSGYDRVIVEPSGIYDVDEFFDALREEPLENWYNIGNVIAIIDGKLPDELSEQAEYLLASEAAGAGMLVISHGDELSGEKREAILAHLNRALEEIHCDRRFQLQEDAVCTEIPQITEAELTRLSGCGYRIFGYRKMALEDHKGFDSVYFLEEKITLDAVKNAMEQFFRDNTYGQVFRVKGYFPTENGNYIELNANRESCTIREVPVGQEVIIVIGEHLKEDSIRRCMKESMEQGE